MRRTAASATAMLTLFGQPLSFDSIGVIAGLIASPPLLVWTVRHRLRAWHAGLGAALAAMAALGGASAWSALSPGHGLFGVGLGLLALAAFGAAVSLLSASVAIAVLLRANRRAASASGTGEGEHRPLTDAYRQWQRDEHRPHGPYQDFLRTAHPRYFPSSVLSLIVTALALVLVFFLIGRV